MAFIKKKKVKNALLECCSLWGVFFFFSAGFPKPNLLAVWRDNPPPLFTAGTCLRHQLPQRRFAVVPAIGSAATANCHSGHRNGNVCMRSILSVSCALCFFFLFFTCGAHTTFLCRRDAMDGCLRRDLSLRVRGAMAGPTDDLWFQDWGWGGGEGGGGGWDQARSRSRSCNAGM